MSPNDQETSQTTRDPSIPFIIDGHQDIAWNWIELRRDPRESALAGRQQEQGTSLQATAGIRTTGLPEWLQGRLGVILASLFVPPERHGRLMSDRFSYKTVQEAHDHASHQLDKYWELGEREARVSLIDTRSELDRVVASWTDATIEPIVGLIVSMEGADPIREPAETEEWYARGLRAVGLSWAATRYAGGTGEPGPLTPLGRRLLSVMADLNMILDLSHMAERACLEALDAYPGPVIASHSNPYRFCPTDRSLSDETIQRLADRGGVVGIVPFNTFLKPDWKQKEDVPIDLVAQVIDHVAQLTGSSGAVGLGSDFDGGLGADSIPAGMDTVADLILIADALSSRGYSQPDIELIMYGNWLRILQDTLR
jgi:membrane dipeptidase